MKKDNYPKISIITPSYNQGAYLEETICSVLNQNYPNLEYIVIDGGSTDNSLEILKKYDQQIDYWVSEKDRGQAHAINKGFKKATGDIIGWLNSDDAYVINILSRIKKIFDTREVSWFSGAVENFNETTGAKGIIKQKTSERKIDWLLHKTAIHQPGVFWRKNVMDEVGFLNEDYHYTFDWDYWCRFVLHGYFPYVDNTIVVSKFRLHEESKTSSQWSFFLKEFILLAEQYKKTNKISASENDLFDSYIIDLKNKLLIKESYSNLVNYNFKEPIVEVTSFLSKHPTYLLKNNNLKLAFDVFLKYPLGMTVKRIIK